MIPTIPRLARGFVGLLTLLCCAPQLAGACTRDEAFNRMMALNQYAMKMQAAMPDPLKDPNGYNAKLPRFMDFNTRLTDVGPTLAADKWTQACAAYDALAKDYHVDIAAQGVRPLSALEAESKHPPKNGCDLEVSARRSMWMVEAFQKRAETENFDRELRLRFGKDTEQVGLLMQQDPEAACAMIDAIVSKYGLR